MTVTLVERITFYGELLPVRLVWLVCCGEGHLNSEVDLAGIT